MIKSLFTSSDYNKRFLKILKITSMDDTTCTETSFKWISSGNALRSKCNLDRLIKEIDAWSGRK